MPNELGVLRFASSSNPSTCQNPMFDESGVAWTKNGWCRPHLFQDSSS